MTKRVLELGNYLAPAYAGMILAEQGHAVEKWATTRDPLLRLRRGDELWRWVNLNKSLRYGIEAAEISDEAGRFDIVIDNFLPETLAKWSIDPVSLAEKHSLVWVSLRSDTGGRSFDVVAQARSWAEYGTTVPFYLGDTAAGLWLAFKALAAPVGHYVIGHGSCLQKLVEGELILDVPRVAGGQPWWDDEVYRFIDGEAHVEYRGDMVIEPIRNRDWKLANLWHEEGRILI